MQNTDSEPRAAGQPRKKSRKSSAFKRSDPTKRSPPIPPEPPDDPPRRGPPTPPEIPHLSVEVAAAALMKAVDDRIGLGGVNHVRVSRTWVGAYYVDASDRDLGQWRSERDAIDGVFPGFDD